MRNKKILSLWLAAMLAGCLLAGCTAEPDLSPNAAAVPAQVLFEAAGDFSFEPVEADEDFVIKTADFSVELFKRSYSEKENSLISPVSVLFAMSMTANGARGETLAQMENVLGGGFSIGELNGHLRNYMALLPSEEKAKLNIANSIWFRDSFQVHDEFLQINRDYFNAEVRAEPFDQSAVDNINAWVDKNTDGMIDKIIDDISVDKVMYLINAIAFDAQWAKPYEPKDLREDDFTNIKGKKQKTNFMHSTEWRFLQDKNATGFIKPYETGYSFAAILPNKSVKINNYISSMTGESFLKLFNNVQQTEVITAMPKFSYEYDISMIEPLKKMGITKAFEERGADLLGIGIPPPGENIFISDILHKTFIEVDEKGTRAAAVTGVTMVPTSIPPPPKRVILDRPFIYAIIDNETNLPVFIGVLMEIP